MAGDEVHRSSPEDEGGETVGDEEPRNPFDNPYFLPLLLFGFSLWFAYDGWFDPTTKSVTFNRVGAPLLLAAALWFALRARRSALRERADGEGNPDDGTPS